MCKVRDKRYAYVTSEVLNSNSTTLSHSSFRYHWYELLSARLTSWTSSYSFSYINIRQVPWEVLKTVAEGRGFQHLPRDLANVNALENHVRSLLLHKN